MTAELAPHLLGADLDAGAGRDDEHRGVGNPQRRKRIADEVEVARLSSRVTLWSFLAQGRMESWVLLVRFTASGS